MRDWKKIFDELGVEFEAIYLKDLCDDIDAARQKQRGSTWARNPEDVRPYAPIWLYRKRLNDVLGIRGYRIFVRDTKVQNAVKRGVDILTVQVTLQLLEDDCRSVAFETEKPGIAEITGAASLQLNLGKATSAGLKDCCEEFGIGGDIEWIWKKAHNVSGNNVIREKGRTDSMHTQKVVKDAHRQEDELEKEEVFRVTPCGKMSEGRNGSFYIPVTIQNGEECTLWFYRDRYEPLLSEPSRFANRRECTNRFDDIRRVWPESRGVLTLKGQRNKTTEKLYFHCLIDSKSSISG